MPPKLTKDQKRAKKKRDEGKRFLQRQHEGNRQAKKLDNLLTAVLGAIDGEAQQVELNQAILLMASGQSVAASDAQSRFQTPAWNRLMARTSRMVALLQHDPGMDIASIGAQGRVFLNGDGTTDFSTHFFPLYSCIASDWNALEVVWRTAQAHEPEPTHGAYFFGMEFRHLAVHFAIASTAEHKDNPEIYFVTPQGWHRLDYRAWVEELWPTLRRVNIAIEMRQGPSRSQYSIATLVEAMKDVEDAEASQAMLTSKKRMIIDGLGAELVIETEAMVVASDSIRARESAEAYARGWDEGAQSKQGEVNALYSLCRRHESTIAELAQKRRPAQPALSQANVPVAAAAPQPMPLAERMGALLGF